MINMRLPQFIAMVVTVAWSAVNGSFVAAAPIDFSHDVVPILKQHCVECHGGKEAKGSFSLNTRVLLDESGQIDLDDVPASNLLELITSTDPEVQMPPPKHDRVPAKSAAVLKQWLAEGMQWEPGFTFGTAAYEPPLAPRRVELPAIVNGRDNPVDRILDAGFIERDVRPPMPISDATFYRRVSMDLVGLLPEAEALEKFIADDDPGKRNRLIAELLADDVAYADHWMTFFNDLLRNAYTGTGFITGGRKQVTKWLYDALVNNKPFDEMVRDLIAPPTDDSRGFIDGIRWRGTVSAGQTNEIQFAQSISQSFLGINMKCASCHDSFIDRWTLDEAYGLAAIYASTPLTIHRCDKPTERIAKAGWLFPELGQVDPNAARDERLKQLANLMTHPENGRFSRTIVNRLWARMMGRGIVHPLDAMQTEPWNEDLLDYLASDFTDHGYDLKRTLALIATSQAYQSQTENLTAEIQNEARYEYRGPRARRMTAEQFMDAVWKLTGAAPKTYDAGIFRGKVTAEELQQFQITANWIWGGQTDGQVPAGKQLAFSKELNLDDNVANGGLVITCDNGFLLFVNGKQIASSNDWTKPVNVPVNGVFKKGTNSIVVIATNAGTSPNPAALFLEGRLLLKNGTMVTVKTDESWTFSEVIPSSANKKIGPIRGAYHPVDMITPIKIWSDTIDAQAKQTLALAALGEGMPMVRASLMKNNALMKSLGRPNRDQIVSARPDLLTTLEAIDLANEATLANAFLSGANQWVQRFPDDPENLVRALFRTALSREPTEQERAITVEMLGEKPTPEAVQDLLWAVSMLPEFVLIQ